MFESSDTQVWLCCAPEFVWGFFLVFPGLRKTGASLHGIWDVVLVPFVVAGWQL